MYGIRIYGITPDGEIRPRNRLTWFTCLPTHDELAEYVRQETKNCGHVVYHSHIIERISPTEAFMWN